MNLKRRALKQLRRSKKDRDNFPYECCNCRATFPSAFEADEHVNTVHLNRMVFITYSARKARKRMRMRPA